MANEHYVLTLEPNEFRTEDKIDVESQEVNTLLVISGKTSFGGTLGLFYPELNPFKGFVHLNLYLSTYKHKNNNMLIIQNLEDEERAGALDAFIQLPRHSIERNEERFKSSLSTKGIWIFLEYDFNTPILIGKNTGYAIKTFDCSLHIKM